MELERSAYKTANGPIEKSIRFKNARDARKAGSPEDIVVLAALRMLVRREWSRHDALESIVGALTYGLLDFSEIVQHDQMGMLASTLSCRLKQLIDGDTNIVQACNAMVEDARYTQRHAEEYARQVGDSGARPRRDDHPRG